MRLLRLPGRALLAGAFLFALSACAKTDKLVIYATARGGGWLWARPGEDPGKGEAGGYAVLKKVYDLETKPKLAVDLGNWFSETPEGLLTKGVAAADCMNSVPYAVSALGTEDMSLTAKDLEKMVKAAAFPVVASNLYLKAGKKPDFVKSQQLLTAGKTRIGFLSVVVMDPERPNTPKHLPNYRFEKASYEIERSLKALKDAGADITVLLMGMNAKKKARKDFYAAFFARLPRLDLIITDDPELKKPARVSKAWLIPAPPGLLAAARIELSIDPASGRMLGAEHRLIGLDVKKYGQDAATLAVAGKHRADTLKYFSRRVGAAADDLKRAAAGSDSALGDFTADCARRWARTNAAIVNNSIFSGDIPKGDVTLGDLRRVLPCDTSVVFVKIRGEDLERAVEEMASKDISVSGLDIRMKGGAVDSLLIEGRPVAPNHIYHVAVPDSIVTDKEYSLLSSATEFANSRTLLREAVRWCFSKYRTVPRPEGGRIVRTDAGERK